ncbi:MAG: GTPase [Syntrophomonadaceae bacterium]|jgi:GTP-binding protein EngB required for normal cell division
MLLTQQPKPQKDLSDALIECTAFAKRGHMLANDAVSLLKRVVRTVSEKLQGEITNLEISNFNDNATTGSLVSQLSSIRSNFEILPQRLMEDIDALSKTSFSITLFGRTMAGKSTLMEILTHGKGESIGKGAQRTTRDVRPYTYRDLQITDVPGIAAFEGKEDEDVAFDAAKKSDLILFLITDDAPQASEAECLNRILGLGKPVICLINIKADINNSTNLKTFRRDVQKKFDNERLDTIKQQFFDFGTQYGQDWRTIRFAYVHLKSAFLSQQSDFKKSSDELYGLSRFNYVENLIVSEISKNGSFYKLKAFSDIVVVPVVDALETLFSQSTQNSEQGSILVGKRKKLKKWTDDFESDGKSRIETLLSSISSELKREIATFAEDNYDNSNASDEWNKILKARKVEQRASDLLKQLGKECEEELREISREINSEIKFSHTVFSDSSINMHMLVDGKRIWNWATTLVSGGLIITSLFLSGPIGWIGLGVGLFGWLGSFLFSDREKKIRDARQKLEKKLSDHIDKMIVGLRKKMLDVLYNELLKKHLYPMIRTIDDVVSSIFMLSKTQQEFAVALNSKLQEINAAVIKEAFSYLGYAGLEWHIVSIARIPGYAMMIVLEDGKRFPDDASKALFYLLKEKVWFVFKKENLKSMLSQAIGRGCDRDTIRIQYIDHTPRIAHIPSLDTVDASTKNRIRMAQQITELLIMK